MITHFQNFRAARLAAAVLVAVLLANGFTYAQDTRPSGAAADDAGQIALVGTDDNIHLYDVASDTFTQLTGDAIPGRRIYTWPTWANNGLLAYFGTSIVDDAPYRLGIFIQPPGADAQQVYRSPNETFTYASWSPGPCPAGDCRDLVLLYTQPRGDLAVRRVRWSGASGTATIDKLAEGGPFYWDWSPDGQSMLWARQGTTLELYDVAQDAVIQTFDEQQGVQRAVDWSPVDDRWLSAVQNGPRASDLVVFDGAARTVLAEDVPGVLAFAWSADGSRVAYASGDTGDLRVVDAATGTEQTVVASDVIGFFWSPDGTRLAYITVQREKEQFSAKRVSRHDAHRAPIAQDSTLTARWYVYEVASGNSQRFDAFVPSRAMLYYLQFYDQFARSHRLWSPDSRYLVYGALDAGEGTVVRLIDTSAPGSAARDLMAGSIGVFSW